MQPKFMKWAVFVHLVDRHIDDCAKISRGPDYVARAKKDHDKLRTIRTQIPQLNTVHYLILCTLRYIRTSFWDNVFLFKVQKITVNQGDHPKGLVTILFHLFSQSFKVDKIIGLPCGEIANKCNKLKEIPIHSENDLIQIVIQGI